MRVTSKGQVTIPAKIRERAGLLPRTEVEILFDGESVYIVKAKAKNDTDRGERLVRRLRGRATVKMPTDQILKLTRGP